MKILLALSRWIDEINARFGVIANWLVLFACLISAGNAASRYLFNESSNAWLEIQWYMFAGMVLLGGPYTLKMNEHVRVDLVYGMVSERTRIWIDIVCGFLFLLPICVILVWFTWPWFVDSWRINEGSSNAGGLVRWPVKLMMPIGFGLMALQGISEIIKRIGYGRDAVALWISRTDTPVPADMKSGLHFCFDAPTRKSVAAFHAGVLGAGGKENGKPGLRTDYGPNYYAAFAIDPDGYRIEAYCGAEA